MSIQTAQLEMFSVQEETVGSEMRFTKPRARFVFVNTPAILEQSHSHVVELRTIEFPRIKGGKAFDTSTKWFGEVMDTIGQK